MISNIALYFFWIAITKKHSGDSRKLYLLQSYGAHRRSSINICFWYICYMYIHIYVHVHIIYVVCLHMSVCTFVYISPCQCVSQLRQLTRDTRNCRNTSIYPTSCYSPGSFYWFSPQSFIFKKWISAWFFMPIL